MFNKIALIRQVLFKALGLTEPLTSDNWIDGLKPFPPFEEHVVLAFTAMLVQSMGNMQALIDVEGWDVEQLRDAKTNMIAALVAGICAGFDSIIAEATLKGQELIDKTAGTDLARKLRSDQELGMKSTSVHESGVPHIRQQVEERLKQYDVEVHCSGACSLCSRRQYCNLH